MSSPFSPLPSAPCLLLVDDSINDLRILIDLLAARGWRLITAFDGEDGYHKAQTRRPDVILMDVRMPKLDGFAACRLLKANLQTAAIPVLFLTAATDKEERLTGLAVGGVDYILKPFVCEEEVVARLGIHLDLARALNRGGEPAFSFTKPQSMPSVLRAAIDHLYAALKEETFSVEKLAGLLGVSEKRLNALFRSAFGLTVTGWLREQRLHLARQLLVQTETPISEIALHCGYGGPANFSTAFRERFGVSPRAFRMKGGVIEWGDAHPNGHAALPVAMTTPPP